MDQWVSDGEGVFACLDDGETIGDCVAGADSNRRTRRKARGEARCIRGFYAYYLQVRLKCVTHGCHPGEQAATAYRNEDRIGIRDLFEDFKGEGPLAGNDVRGIEGMDVSEVLLLCQTGRFVAGFVEGIPMKEDGRAELAAASHFHQGCESWHYHCDWKFQQTSVPGEAEGMVAGGSSNDSPARLIG